MREVQLIWLIDISPRVPSRMEWLIDSDRRGQGAQWTLKSVHPLDSGDRQAKLAVRTREPS